MAPATRKRTTTKRMDDLQIRLPYDVTESIFIDIIQEELHKSLVFISSFATRIQEAREETEWTRSRSRSKPKSTDAVILALEQDLRKKLDGIIKWRPILNLCQSCRQHRTVMERLLEKLFPRDFTSALLDTRKKALPSGLTTAIISRNERLPDQLHLVLNRLCTLEDLGLCCLEIGNLGVKKFISPAEELSGALLSLKPIRDSPIAWTYLFNARLRAAIYYRIEVDPSPSGSCKTLSGLFARKKPKMTPWHEKFLREATDELSVLPSLLCLVESAGIINNLIVSIEDAIRNGVEYLEPYIDLNLGPLLPVGRISKRLSNIRPKIRRDRACLKTALGDQPCYESLDEFLEPLASLFYDPGKYRQEDYRFIKAILEDMRMNDRDIDLLEEVLSCRKSARSGIRLLVGSFKLQGKSKGGETSGDSSDGDSSDGDSSSGD